MNMNAFWQLAGNVALMYGILIVVNLPAPFLGLEFESGGKPRLWYQPPGFVIPIVWFVLFTLLGIARFQIARVGVADSPAWWIVALAVVCATYAYYTLGLAKLTGISAMWFGLWGNIGVIILSTVVFTKVYAVVPATAWPILPVAIWTFFATLVVIGEMKLV
jgi:tryptophan-rich sensory protein